MAFVNPEGLREVEVDRYPKGVRQCALISAESLLELS
jgi:hypothetical protein